MTTRDGRSPLASLAPALLLLLLLPAAAPAQCQHMGQQQQAGGMPQMSQTGMIRFLAPRLSMMQTQQIQMVAMQQVQLLLLQQTQLMTMQQVLAARQLGLLTGGPQEMNPIRQPGQGLPALLPAAPAAGPPLGKQYAELLRDMTDLQRQLDTLEQAAGLGELAPQQASDAQHRVVAMEDRVAALPKAPAAVRERLAALRDLSDDLLRQVAARPADVLTAIRAAR